MMVYGRGMAGFILDEIELGYRVAVSLDEPDQAWWALQASELPKPRRRMRRSSYAGIPVNIILAPNTGPTPAPDHGASPCA